jgi:hypothetical protein
VWLRGVLMEIAKSLGPLEPKQALEKRNRQPSKKLALRRQERLEGHRSRRPRRLQ